MLYEFYKLQHKISGIKKQRESETFLFGVIELCDTYDSSVRHRATTLKRYSQNLKQMFPPSRTRNKSMFQTSITSYNELSPISERINYQCWLTDHHKLFS